MTESPASKRALFVASSLNVTKSESFCVSSFEQRASPRSERAQRAVHAERRYEAFVADNPLPGTPEHAEKLRARQMRHHLIGHGVTAELRVLCRQKDI